MKINIIQWNISNSSQIQKISAYLETMIFGNAIVCLQEVLESSKEKVVNALRPSDYRFSLDMRYPGKFDGRNRKFGLLTMSFGSNINDCKLIERSVFPERTLVTETDIEETKVKVLNFHSLTGVGYKQGKSSNFASIAEYLNDNELDFFCCDANEPKADSFDVNQLEFWNNGDKGKFPSLIFGKNRVHDLRDSLHSVKDQFENLPVSYKTGKTFRRYDMIFHSNNWEVESLEYKYNDSINATSDHALVLGEYKKCK